MYYFLNNTWTPTSCAGMMGNGGDFDEAGGPHVSESRNPGRAARTAGKRSPRHMGPPTCPCSTGGSPRSLAVG